MAIARTDENAAGDKEIPRAGLLNVQSATFVEALGEHFGETFRHVLHDDDGGRKVRRNL